MKLEFLARLTCHIIRTDQPDHPIYCRDEHGEWERFAGSAWEPCSKANEAELEAAYAEHLQRWNAAVARRQPHGPLGPGPIFDEHGKYWAW